MGADSVPKKLGKTRISFTLYHYAKSNLRDSSPNDLSSIGTLTIDVTEFETLSISGNVTFAGTAYAAGTHDISNVSGNQTLSISSRTWDDRAGTFETSGSVTGYFF